MAFIASLPQPQRGIAEAVDTLAAKMLPNLPRSVKWGREYGGVGDGWCFSFGGFAGHVWLQILSAKFGTSSGCRPGRALGVTNFRSLLSGQVTHMGGFDYEIGAPGDDAFAIGWWVASDNPEIEKWNPEVVTG